MGAAVWGGLKAVGWFALPPAVHDVAVITGLIPVAVMIYGALLWGLRIEGRDELGLLLGKLRDKVSAK